MEKSIQLLKLLSGNRSYSISEIMNRLDVSKRTVYRYLNQIENGGFILERNHGHYCLAQDHSETKRLQRLLHFSEEEAFIFHQSLSSFEQSNTAVKKLIKKLHTLYDFKALARLKLDGNIKNTQNLAQALKNKKRVLLLNYRSSNSDTESDRKVEAFEFMPDYEAVWCLDLEDKIIKQFRISRIQEVEVLKENWRYTHLHKLPFTDAFRMSASKPIAEIKAILSLKAYNLLREEFPAAQTSIKKKSNQYYLSIPIADFHGIGRFVMGLPEDVEVIETDGFINFLKEKRESYKW